jgi:hypothetical protein
MSPKKTLTSLVLVGAIALGLAGKADASLFFDDFESGTASKWVNSIGDWQVIDDNGNKVYRQNMLDEGGSKWKSSTLDFYAENYKAEVDVRFLTAVPGSFGGTLMIYKKTNGSFSLPEPNIAVTLFPNYNMFSLYVYEEGVAPREYQCHVPIEINKWYHMGVNVENGFASGFVDGQKVISDVPTSLDRGYVALNTDGIRADFDNLNITPEPATLGLLAFGALGLAAIRRKK